MDSKGRKLAVTSNFDDEVQRAEQMALAVASTPNLRASEAKEMLSNNLQTTMITVTTKAAARRRRRKVAPLQSLQIQSNRIRLDSSDEEVRRAREMALAVATLGTEKGAMKAEEIRMAIADVISDPVETSRKNLRKTKDKRESQQEETNSSPEKRLQHQKQDSDSKVDGKTSDSRAHLSMEDIMRPPWVLRNQSIFSIVAIANILILYVALSPAPCYTKLSNAVFIFNTAVSFFCVVEKRDPQNMNLDPTIESQTNADLAEFEEENRKNQEALVDEMELRIRPEKSITLEWLSDIQYSEGDLRSLLDLQPDSTLAERRRFLKARKGVIKAASAQLGSYIQWRNNNKIDEFFPSTFTTDEQDWALAAMGAMEITNTGRTSPSSNKMLPRIVSVYGGNDGLVLCKNGARIVHVLPSQLDTTIAPATTYSLALAMYLDRKLDRNHTEKVTVVIDIRSGKGWPNPSSVSLVPFIKLVVGSLNSYFPERLSRCILFPLPMTATVIFNKAKAYLDPDTASKIQVCSGAGSVSAVVPSKVRNFIDEKSIDIMERRRIAFFYPPEGNNEVSINKRIPWSSISP